jgi:thiamine biosynthesis lipoprotein
MPTVTLARLAMATRFEIVLHGDRPVALRAAGEEALNEIERLERHLSLYRPDSEIAHLNARAAREPVKVSPDLFALLQQAKQLSEGTGGAFDITIASLVRCWGFMDGSGKVPDTRELNRCRAQTGLDLVRLDAATGTVRFEREGVMLDLGAIGKGYAVEKAVNILREAGVTSALVHGGTSTVYAIGCPPDQPSWQVAIEPPKDESRFQPTTDNPACQTRQNFVARATKFCQPIGNEQVENDTAILFTLRDEALSVSAVWGKFFEAGGRRLGHVLDPRVGKPVSNGAVLAAVVLPCATETDALSTALLVVGAAGHDAVFGLRPGMRTLLMLESGVGFRLETKGFPVETKGG